MKKVKKSNSKLLRLVENNDANTTLKAKQEEDKNWDTFNDQCKELIKGELRSLFEKNNKIDFGSKVYNFAFHLTQEFIFNKMPIGAYQRALNSGTKEAQQNYLEYIGNEYSIKPREVVGNEKAKTIN
jgi:hypothetical protein